MKSKIADDEKVQIQVLSRQLPVKLDAVLSANGSERFSSVATFVEPSSANPQPTNQI